MRMRYLISQVKQLVPDAERCQGQVAEERGGSTRFSVETYKYRTRSKRSRQADALSSGGGTLRGVGWSYTGSSAGGDWEDEDVDGSVHSSNVWAAQPRARRAGRGGGGYAPSSVADTVDPDPTTAAFDAIAAAGRVEGGGGPAPLLDMAHTPKVC